LVVLTALPTVPIDDQALAVVSVGLPVALAVYCGWLNCDSLPTIKIVGLCAALSGAILGAWLGFHAPASPLLGLLTASVGAAAAANLGLIVVDVAGIGEPAAETAPSIAVPALKDVA
jgi:hypothetical protein